MENARARFLFGDIPPEADLDDAQVRGELLRQAYPDSRPLLAAMRELVATHIATDDPPLTWLTAQRLMALGIDREEALRQLSLAAMQTASRTARDHHPFDLAAFSAAIGSLPLPPAADTQEAVLAAARRDPVVDSGTLVTQALAGLGRSPDDELATYLVEHALDDLADDWGPLVDLPGNVVVHAADLTAGIVLTHRISETERALGVLDISFDLAGFLRREDLTLPEGAPLDLYSEERGQLSWGGPDGWLAPYASGTLVAVRVPDDGTIVMEPIADLPHDHALVTRLRAVYDRTVEEPWLPVSGEDLILGLLAEDRGTFDQPTPALAELCEAAGLERRGHCVAHDESVWATHNELQRMSRIAGRLEDPEDRMAAATALHALLTGAGAQEQRMALAGLRAPEVLSVVMDELLGDGSPEAGVTPEEASERLLAAARRRGEIAVARWIAAVVAERGGRLAEADNHLKMAIRADPLWAPALDRAAWYAADRGDAETAAHLWRRAGGEGTPDLIDIEAFAPETRHRPPGRNDPCWCQSGRKYKNCHLGRPELPPLPDRVGWLYGKAVAYLARRGGPVAEDLLQYAAARALDPADRDSLAAALEDPLVADVVLIEGGWFARFLKERGPLLPPDEASLAAGWALLPRTVYEVLDVQPGDGLAVRDLATGDDMWVRERTVSSHASPGVLLCGRAVPDGATHQFVGALVPVAPGREEEVLDLCQAEDGFGLCQFAARQERPPVLQTREGEPLVACTAIIQAPDETALRATLDAHYDAEEGGWREMFEIADEQILRALLHVEGDQLVVSTYSEPRIERVLGVLRDAVPGLTVVSDRREPLKAEQLADLSQDPLFAPDDPSLTATMPQIQDTIERRWINEPVPALGGLSPLAAAADPGRREAVGRLIAGFPDPSELPPGVVTMRPQRLRELLGLSPLGGAGLSAGGLYGREG